MSCFIRSYPVLSCFSVVLCQYKYINIYNKGSSFCTNLKRKSIRFKINHFSSCFPESVARNMLFVCSLNVWCRQTNNYFLLKKKTNKYKKAFSFTFVFVDHKVSWTNRASSSSSLIFDFMYILLLFKKVTFTSICKLETN